MLALMKQGVNAPFQALPSSQGEINFICNPVRVFTVEPLAKRVLLSSFHTGVRIVQQENELNEIVSQVREFMSHQQCVAYLFEDFSALPRCIEHAWQAIPGSQLTDGVKELKQLRLDEVERSRKRALGTRDFPGPARLLISPVQRSGNRCGDQHRQYSTDRLYPVGCTVLARSSSTFWAATGQCPGHDHASEERHNGNDGPISVSSSLLHFRPPVLERILPLGVAA